MDYNKIHNFMQHSSINHYLGEDCMEDLEQIVRTQIDIAKQFIESAEKELSGEHGHKAAGKQARALSLAFTKTGVAYRDASVKLSK